MALGHLFFPDVEVRHFSFCVWQREAPQAGESYFMNCAYEGGALCLVQGSCWGFYTLITRKHFYVLFSVFLLIHFISCCLPSHIPNSCSRNVSPTVWEDTVGRSQQILRYTSGRTICLLLLDIFSTNYLQKQRVWLLRANPLQWMSCK